MITQLPKIILLQLNVCGHLDSSKILMIIITTKKLLNNQLLLATVLTSKPFVFAVRDI